MTIKDNNQIHITQLTSRPATMVANMDKIMQWGIARNITAEGGATALSQTKKMFEEVQEFVDATTHEEAKDAIGDIFVVLIQMCRLRGYKLDECLAGAWDEIKDRKGTMIDGVFVKETK